MNKETFPVAFELGCAEVWASDFMLLCLFNILFEA